MGGFSALWSRRSWNPRSCCSHIRLQGITLGKFLLLKIPEIDYTLNFQAWICVPYSYHYMVCHLSHSSRDWASWHSLRTRRLVKT